jgi:hypothetical protein
LKEEEDDDTRIRMESRLIGWFYTGRMQIGAGEEEVR